MFRLFKNYASGVLAVAGLLNVSATNAEPSICLDANGDTLPVKLLWQDDFGEFDLSDSTGMTYKVWDYSDLKNPVQVTKKTTTPFRYELEEAPLGCTFQGKGPLLDGEYTVAGVLTGYNSYNGMVGANLEWAADLHGIRPEKGIHYDHSGKPEGCCLFVNCKAQTAGMNVYAREISGLETNTNIIFEVYMSIFTSSAAGPYTPADVTVRLTEVGNENNVIEARATQTLPNDGGTGSWAKIKGSIFLEKGNAIRLEIVNNQNIDQNGNDLVLDDIRLYVCGDSISPIDTVPPIVIPPADTIPPAGYCQDANGDTLPVKLLWQEDFGELDLSDSTGMTYKVWDYSDLKNPVQVTKKTTTPFRYELDDAPLGCTFQGKGPLLDGEYTVAGVLTGYNSYNGMVGANLEWAADLHGIRPEKGIHYDHSGKPEGCCLFVNCKAQTAGMNVYAREISGLETNTNIIFEVYMSIFTSSAAGPYTPADVTVRLTEVGNENNVIEARATQTLPNDGGTGSWAKIKGSIFLEKGNAIRLEIVNNQNIDQNGNDLVLDDIRLLTCDPDQPTNVEPIADDNADDIVNVYTVSGLLVKTKVKRSEALKGLLEGIYVVGNEKMIVR